jgi:hypothetical protein
MPFPFRDAYPDPLHWEPKPDLQREDDGFWDEPELDPTRPTDGELIPQDNRD